MRYAQSKGKFYVQLEDDVITKPNFIATMRSFAVNQTRDGKPWFLINFCKLGFIGKMFQAADLPILIQYLIMFYNDRPCDWLLDLFLKTKACSNLCQTQCSKEKEAIEINYTPSLFQHMGTYSSRKGNNNGTKGIYNRLPLIMSYLLDIDLAL